MTVIYNRGDIVLVNNENAIDNIQSGVRPYLIVSNDKCNAYSNILTVIPMTTKEKTPIPTHYEILINGVQNTFLAEQITCISKKSVIGYLDSISTKDLRNIEKRIMAQLGLQKEEK